MRNGAGMIRLKRVYESPATNDGFRVRSETTVTQVYAVHDLRHNSASVLKEIIEEKLKSSYHEKKVGAVIIEPRQK